MVALKVKPPVIVLHPRCPACKAGPAMYSRTDDGGVSCLMCGRSVISEVVRERIELPGPETVHRGRPPKGGRSDESTPHLPELILNLLALQEDGRMFADELAGALEIAPDRRDWQKAIDDLLLSERVEMDFPSGRVRYRLVA